MTQLVSQIFGEPKDKVLRLFVFNPNSTFTAERVSSRTKERSLTVRREIRTLLKAGLIKRRAKKGYILDQGYPYLRALEKFLIEASPISEKELARKVSGTGSIKLILISGLFLHDKDARVDILIVGDHLRQAKLVSTISSIEALLGKEVRYAAFETADFKYRLGIYDKLIRDILDYQHEKILNKLGI